MILTDGAQRAADRAYGCAYWYAVGRYDAEGGLELSSLFANHHYLNALAYYRGDTFSLLSVPDAYSEYLKVHAIVTERVVARPGPGE